MVEQSATISIDKQFRLLEVVDRISKSDSKSIALQFPDHLLYQSPDVCIRLTELLKGEGRIVYVLADT